MALTFPRDPVVELYLNGWTDVTTSVRQTTPITVTRGRADEQGAVAPSKCTFVLDNTTGNFNPDNPVGAYYGLIGRNTPVRYSLGVATDAFGRTVSSGWGSADTGEAWSVQGTASDFAVGSGVGTHSFSVTNVSRGTYLNTVAVRDADVAVSGSLAVTDITGADVELGGILLRGQASLTYYFVRVRVTTAEQIVISIRINIAGIETALTGEFTVPGLTHTSSKVWRVRGQIEGQTIRGKVWDASTAEPFDWHVTAHDETLTGTGYVGVRSAVWSGNTNTLPLVFSYDAFEYRSMRFAGEVASMQPEWDVTHVNKSVKVEAAGILRRLGQGSSPYRSALNRFIDANPITPSSYWALDDKENSPVGRLTKGAGSDALLFINANGPILNNPSTSARFGKGTIGTWFDHVVGTTDYDSLLGRMPENVTSSFTVYFMVAFSGGVYTTPLLDGVQEDRFSIKHSNQTFSWLIAFLGGNIDTFVDGTPTIHIDTPAGTPTDITITNVGNLFDGAGHLIGFRATQSGADVLWSLSIDGVEADSGTITTLTLGPISYWLWNNIGPQEPSRLRSFGHVVFYAGTGPSIADLTEAAFGYVGETAGRRLERLTNEQDISFGYIGDLDNTASMGPQGTRTLLTLLGECADADAGTQYESCGTIGLIYRTRQSLYHQQAALALDYSAQQISASFGPTHDDQRTRNKVEARRLDGGIVFATQEAGPLNVNDPGSDPTGVGVYASTITVNAERDSQLPDIAGWFVHLGTVDEARFPGVTVNLLTSGVPSSSVLDVEIDDRITIDNLTVLSIYDQVTQLARGYTEVLDTAYRHTITFNTAPESPYHILTFDDATHRWDSDGSTLSSGITSSATSLSVAVVGALWTTTGAQFPFNIKIGGEVMTLSAIIGTTSPQTFTVSARSVNGVVKAHSAGAAVHLASPFYFGL